MAFGKVDHLSTNLMELAKFVKHEKLPLSATHGRPGIQFVHLEHTTRNCCSPVQVSHRVRRQATYPSRISRRSCAAYQSRTAK